MPPVRNPHEAEGFIHRQLRDFFRYQPVLPCESVTPLILEILRMYRVQLCLLLDQSGMLLFKGLKRASLILRCNATWEIGIRVYLPLFFMRKNYKINNRISDSICVYRHFHPAWYLFLTQKGGSSGVWSRIRNYGHCRRHKLYFAGWLADLHNKP